MTGGESTPSGGSNDSVTQGDGIGKRVEDLIAQAHAWFDRSPGLEDLALFCIRSSDLLRTQLEVEYRGQTRGRETRLTAEVGMLRDQLVLLRDDHRRISNVRNELEAENDGVLAQNASLDHQLQGTHAEIQRLQRNLRDEEDKGESYLERLRIWAARRDAMIEAAKTMSPFLALARDPATPPAARTGACDALAETVRALVALAEGEHEPLKATP